MRAGSRPRHFVFSGGGSGGHLTPAIAVAEALFARDQYAHVTFLTSGRDVDRIVLSSSFVAADSRCSVVPLPLTQPPRPGLSAPAQIRDLWTSFRRCRRLLLQQPAGAMLSTGAFASVPGLLAARRLNIPVVQFEANVLPGRVNRWWSRRAVMNLCGWPAARGEAGCPNFHWTGMPVRADVRRESGSDGTAAGCEAGQILIVGGSQGSRRLNQIVRAAISRSKLPQHWSVLHQTGADDQTDVSDRCSARVRTTAWIDQPVMELSRSSFVISRAGAVTLGELAATGCPSILVPLSSAANNHQQQNAVRFVRHGAALLVDETGAAAVDDLVAAMNRLIASAEARASMRQAAQSLHRPGAADEIAGLLIGIADRSQRHQRS